MRGPARRMIIARGREYTVENSPGGGGRSTPDYSSDGTIMGVLEMRGRPRTLTDSDGTEVDSDLEIRAVNSGGIPIRGVGDPDGYPTRLIHPDGVTYRVLAKTPEDSGVTVLSVVKD